MKYKFLQKDADALIEKIQELYREQEFLAKDAALSISQSSESWHDNAGFEVALRQQSGISKRLKELKELEINMEIVEPSTSHKQADIGSEITIKDLETGEETSRVLSSYRVLDKRMDNEIPYSSPIGNKFMNTKPGSVQKIFLPGREVKYELISIRPAEGLIN